MNLDFNPFILFDLLFPTKPKMKLDTSHMRYLTTDDFRVLQAVEQGSKSHEVVPTLMIHQISGMRSQSGTNRAISDLAKLSLISKMRNIKYDGYRLTYNGIDYLALKTMLNRDTVYSCLLYTSRCV